MNLVAIDWSGDAQAAQRHIWLAETSAPGSLTRLENGRDRTVMADHLVELIGASRVAIGLDFSFSFPAWFVRQLGLVDGPGIWTHVVEQGEAWLSSCETPFWGRRGRPRPLVDGPSLRRAEQAVPRTAGISPKSVFQIGGAGSVGTGSIRGMALLVRLASAGAAVWPFASGATSTVVEIYPRLLTGPVRKSRPAERAALLEERFPCLSPEHRLLAIGSEDAFDAAVSALVMAEHAADLATLPAEIDPELRLEGRIWHPAWRSDRL